ncbi:hypothetical protein [Glutamicibacter sp.]|jgi:hypothetical protein|uniref:hypothetical protein n=1 Tax=Glutamicibacter sp. TaxID=1931995 RepID=UPI002B4A5F23|nr:hypothetical protein [Glutamicibacter sp.]
MSSELMAAAEEYMDPVKYKLILKTPDESETTYEFDSFDTDNAPFVLQTIDVNPSSASTGDFAFTIDDSKDKVIRDTIECGHVAIIQAAKKQENYKNIMWGIIDDITEDYPIANKLLYSFRGLGYGVVLNYTILNFLKSANKDDIVGNTVLNDPAFRIDNLALEAFTSTDILPLGNSPTLQDRGGYLLDSLANTIRVTMPTVNAPLTTAATILENFAASSGTVFHVDADKKVYLRPPYKVHSGIIIRQWEVYEGTNQPITERLNDPAETTAYYFGGWSGRKFMKVDQGFFNQVFLTINTDQIISSASGTDTPNFTSLAKKDVGQQFIPGSTKLFNVALLLSKAGIGRSSVDDAYDLTGVQGLICEDTGDNHPSSKIIATFNIPYDQITEAPVPIYNIALSYRMPTIDQNKKHWILLFKRGENEDNTIRWHHDSDFTTASTDALPRYSGTKKPFTDQPTPYNENFEKGWGVNSKGPVHRFSFFATNKTTISAADPMSIKLFTPNRPVEIRVNAPWIHDISTGFKYANTLLQYGAKLKRIYEKKQLSIPNKLFYPLQLANIVYPPAGINQNSNLVAEINSVHYSANSFDAENPYGSYFVELTCVGYMNHFQSKFGESIICQS